MKYIQHIFFSLVLLVSLFGCEQTVFINQHGYEPRVSVESEIVVDSLPKIYLTETQNYYGYLDFKKPAKYIETAKVVLTHNGIEDELTPTEGKTDTLTVYSGNMTWDTIYTKQKYYLGHNPCKKGEKYELIITYNGKEITSEMTVPNLIFEPATAEQKEEIISYPGGNYTERFVEIGVKDPAGLGSYYRAKMIYLEVQYIYDYNPNTQEYEIVDSTVNYAKFSSEIISDEVNDGGLVKIKMMPYIYPSSPEDTGLVKTFISIECLDNASGKYLESIFSQGGNSGDPFSEPTLLYSNIKNGIGFFGSYQVVDTMTFMYKKGY